MEFTYVCAVNNFSEMMMMMMMMMMIKAIIIMTPGNFTIWGEK